MLDVFCTLYKGEYLSGTGAQNAVWEGTGTALDGQLLQVLQVEAVDWEEIQFGGIASGTYTLNYKYEDSGNFLAPNRIDGYRRLSTLHQQALSGFVNLQVADGSQFLVGQGVAIYDGLNFDFGYVTAVSGNQITLDNPIFHGYDLGATVFILWHRGRVSQVNLDVSMQNIQGIVTQGYFLEIAQKVLDSSSVAKKECGWVLNQIVNLYKDQVDIFISSSNITQTTDASGNLNGTGTNMAYNSTFANRPLIQVVQDIVNCANGNPNNIGNGNPSGTTYMVWVDAPNALHFEAVNTATPTRTFDLTTNPSTDDGLFDCVTDFKSPRENLTAVTNVYKIAGAVDPTTQQPITCEVFDQNSVNQYGQIEQSISNPNVFDVDTLKAYGVALLNATAYPIRQFTLTVGPVKNFVTCRDYIEVTGFKDGSTETFNPLSVHTTWSSSMPGVFQQTIQGGQLLPNITKQMKQISNEHYVAAIGVTSGGVAIKDRFVATGLDGSYTGATFSMTAGVFDALCTVGDAQLNTEFDIPAYSTTLPKDGVYSISYLYRNTDGTQIAFPTMVMYSGISADSSGLNSFTDYQVCPFFQVSRLGGVITNAVVIQNRGGINAGNINQGQVGKDKFKPNPNTALPPTLVPGTAVTGPTYPSSTGGGSYDAALIFNLNYAAYPDMQWAPEVRAYAVDASLDSAVPTLTMATSSFILYEKNRIPKGDHSLTAAGDYTLIWGSLTSGVAYKLYVTYLDITGNPSPPLYLATTDANPILLDTKNLPGMPDPTNTRPSLDLSIPQQPLVYPSVGWAAYDAETVVAVNSVGTLANAWLAEVELVTQPVSTTTSGITSVIGDTSNWTFNDSEFPNTNGIYQFTWANLGAGQQFNLGLRYKDHKNQTSQVLLIGTTVQNPIQGKAIDANTITKDHLDGMYSEDGKLIFEDFPGVIQEKIDPDSGALILSDSTGQIASGSNSDNVQATIGDVLNGNSYLKQKIVGNVQITDQQVDDTKVLFNHYSTSIVNSKTNDLNWYLEGTGSTFAFEPLTTGQITYVNTTTDPSTGFASTDSFYLDSGHNIECVFEHAQPFQSGSSGRPLVQFKGYSVSSGTTTLDTAKIAYSGTTNISETSDLVTTNQRKFRDIGSFASTATVSQVQTPNSQQVQHNSGYLNPQAFQGSSTAYINSNVAITPQSRSNPDIPVAMMINTEDGSGLYTRADNALIGSGIIATDSNALADGAHAISLDYSFPNTIGGGGGTSYAIYWNVFLVNASSTVVWGPVSGVTGASTYTAFVNGGTGIYTWVFQPQFVDDNATGFGPSGPPLQDDDGFAHAGATVRWSASSGGYSTTGGPIIAFCNTGANTNAPTSAATQLVMHVSNTNYYADAFGQCEVVVYLYAPNGSLIEYWIAPAPGSNLTYSNGAAAAGNYTWAYSTVVAVVNNNGASSYASNIDGFATWYQTDQYFTYTYINGAADAGQQFYTDPGTTLLGTRAPTSSDVCFTVLVESLNAASNGYATAGLMVNVFDPNNNIVLNHQITATGVGYDIIIPGTLPGQYRFQLYSAIVSNAHTQGGTTAEGGGNYSVTASGQVLWYDAVGVSGGLHFTEHVGASNTYPTSSGTLVPNSLATALTLNLTSVVCPADANGHSFLNAVLLDPNGATVQTSNAFSTNGTLTYWNAAQTLAGVYTWILQADCSNNDAGESTYAVSASGTQGYYVIGGTGGGTYVLAGDGVTHRTQTNDADILWTRFTPDTIGFKIFNDSSDASHKQFDIGISISGI